MPELSPMPIAECSTPFGIIGIFTEVFDEHGPRFGVLNAFRHHWNLHLGCRSSRPCRLPSAQRLSVSLESSPKCLTSTAPALACSTPFGIIGIFTWDAGALAHADCRVLNAFRYHWNLHRSV